MKMKSLLKSVSSKDLANLLLFLLQAQKENTLGEFKPMQGQYLQRVLSAAQRRFHLNKENLQDMLILLHAKGALRLEILDEYHRNSSVNRLFIDSSAKVFIYDTREAIRSDRRSKRWDILKMVLSAICGSGITLLVSRFLPV